MPSASRTRIPTFLYLGVLALCSCKGLDLFDSAGEALNVPVIIEESAGYDRPATPISMGIPFPIGELRNVPELEIRHLNDAPIPALGSPLSYWNDGSIRWLQLEFILPQLSAAETFEATLNERSKGLHLGGDLHLVELVNGQGWRLDNGLLRVESGQAPGELFSIISDNNSPLAGPLRTDFESLAEEFQAEQQLSGPVVVERSNELSVTLKRVDKFLNQAGREVARITTRLTMWRGINNLRIQQSLDLVAGTHKMNKWDLIFPLKPSATTTSVLLPDDSTRVFAGDFTVRQTAHDEWRMDGVDFSGRLAGVGAVDGMAIGMRHFWQLHPSGLRREGNDFRLEICPGTTKRIQVLEEGFGRTQEIWLHFGRTNNAIPLADLGRMLEAPLLGRTSADQYVDSAAIGNVALAIPGNNPAIEETMAISVDELLARREKFAEYDYGIEGFGDYFSAKRNPSYWGAMQQEYDPAAVMLMQFMRTGEISYLEPALESAWHYADVDIAPYGGAFQHRATRHHLEAWIAKLFTVELIEQARNSSEYDGTINGLIAWAELAYDSGFTAKLERWINHEQENGAIGAEIKDRALLMIGANEVLEIEASLEAGGEIDMLQMATGIAGHPRSQALGFTDPNTQFEPFFDLFGGSWENFPSFHVDNDPIPDYRHMGSHAVIQGVTWAYFLTGEPRLGEVALKFARHHTKYVIPAAIENVIDVHVNSSNKVFTRNVAWPLVNTLTLMDLTTGQNQHQQLHADLQAAADLCAQTLIEIDYTRIRSSINAGITMEALAEYHRFKPSRVIADYLIEIAQNWSQQLYNWSKHGFHNEPNRSDEPGSGVTGLCVYGLAYAHTLDPNPDLGAVVLDAWEHFPQTTSYGKAFGMHYRGAPRAMKLIRAQQTPN